MATPEGVVLDYSLAGVGSRFVAGFIDFTVQLSIIGCAVLFFAFLAGLLALSGVGEGFLIALTVITVFAGTYGYDVAFEALRNGQTPGKEVMGLRVVRDGGLPVDFKAAAIRNLVGIVDGPLTAYVVGSVSIIATRKNQRLGDIAAGTLVIRERTGADGDRPPPAPPGYAEKRAKASEAEAPDPAPAFDRSELSEGDVAVVRRFLARRATLDPAARRNLAGQLAGRVEPLVAGVERGDDDEHFLEVVAAAKDRA